MGPEVGASKGWKGIKLYTIGHSTRTLEDFVALLRAFDVSVVVDIRTIPRSRHNPQFNGDALRSTLRARRLRYVHLPELGGLRRAQKDSPNSGWRNASFRGFADYMLTEDFETGLAKLHALTAKQRIALMCAEAVPWRCHRSLVADALTARGAHVEDITSANRSTPHRLTTFAMVEGTRVTYPVEDSAGRHLATRAPFHLEATVRVLQRRATNRVDVWEQDRYVRVLATTKGLALVEIANRGTIDAPDLRLAFLQGKRSSAACAMVEQTVRKILGLDVDPTHLQRLAAAESRLGPTALALRGMRPPRFADLFEAFANVVPFQQVSLDAGVAIVGRLVERFGESVEHDGRRFHAFPTAQVIADARLGAIRECGLSVRKAETLRQIASAIESSQLTQEELLRMSSEEAIRFLEELNGIGPWSASLILLRGLGRLDVFPPGDVGVARGLSRLMGVEPGPSLDGVLQRFGDYRGYLYFCSLGDSLLAKGLIRAAPLRPRARKSEDRSPTRSTGV
jgi:3-methyladenine DNA glycosylase/8-oxoguanine DNA glycosylase